MRSIFDITALKRTAAMGPWPEELALVLIGVIFETGKSRYLENLDKEGFSNKAMGERDLELLPLSIKEETMLSDPDFALSLYAGALYSLQRTKEVLGRELTPKELWPAIKMSFDDVFPAKISERLFEYFLISVFPFYSKKTVKECKQLLVNKKARQKRFLEEFYGCKAVPQPKPTGTETWLVPCPSCGTEKRCDAKTRRFKCKCGAEKVYDGSKKAFVDN